MDYEKLLESAYEKMPKDALKTERFEVPKVSGHIQGNKTVISNFYQIADVIGRKPEHLMKYVLGQLAAPGELSKTALMMGTKIPASRINEKIQQYVKEFVICRECKKPDTKLVKDSGVVFIKCAACGARHVVK